MISSFFSRATFFRACAGALALSVVGCATFNSATPEAQVGQRAAAYWKARQAGQLDKAYALTAPSYRQVRTIDQFRRDLGVAALVQGVEVTSVNCEPERCVARIKLEVSPSLPGVKLSNVSTHLNEIWLLEDGQWWRYQDL